MTYSFSNSASTGHEQLDLLASLLDGKTQGHIEALDLPEAAQCWIPGAGSGTIARWLAERDPQGLVLATDIDPKIDEPLPKNLIIEVHDLTTDPYRTGWDLIAIRLVLCHLPQRQQILQQMAAALKPGGWLLIEDWGWSAPPSAYAAPTPADAALFDTMSDANLTQLQDRGADPAWAESLQQHMDQHLTDVQGWRYDERWEGGSPGCRLHAINLAQHRERLLADGITADELDRAAALLTDPALRTYAYALHACAGRRPPL
ncbi:hypothetical protein BIV57_10810 [Mangrovactinospora gilvigrisea]|uniref:Methyltransferase type 12 domain-containing protein n=1 Tax=Mangrovactinospora gilvigrisea TaxID=1428644 RepID=A0A1J7BFJ9_9ACTN|nr:class I SAM-dependent methyltransferase [Mangrovactinospora gilvigrisea]OIV37451.1 hypothetical protein BIV57_10810 [Mangrovactinospora gilvigrisea]